MKDEKLTLTQEWDKTFPQSGNVTHSKITFHNRYGITLAADMYVPKNVSGKLPAIAVAGPFLPVCMHKRWQNMVFLRLPLIHPTPEKVVANQGMSLLRILIQKISVPL